MKLTPLDIKRHSFEKGFRGYDSTEVDSFLKQVADQFESLQEELRLAHERTRETEGKLQHYERVEMALQEALESAKASAQRSEEDAARRSAVIIEEAELRAQQILQDVERERFGMKQDLVRLSSRQAEVAARLRGFLMSELEVLSDFQGAPAGLLQMDEPEPFQLPAETATSQDAAAQTPTAESVAVESVAVENAAVEDPADATDSAPTDNPGAAGDDLSVSDAVVSDITPLESPAAAVPPVSFDPAPVPEPSAPTEAPASTDASLDDPWDAAPPYPTPGPTTPRVEISSRAGEGFLPPDDSEVLGPPTPVSDDVPITSGGWTAPPDQNVAASEAERERIRRILEDLD